MESLRTYLNSLTPTEQAAFAFRCGTTLGYLRKALSIRQQLGADLCIEIERESARRVRVEALRPDVDWAYLRDTNCPNVGADTTATEAHQEVA